MAWHDAQHHAQLTGAVDLPAWKMAACAGGNAAYMTTQATISSDTVTLASWQRPIQAGSWLAPRESLGTLELPIHDSCGKYMYTPRRMTVTSGLFAKRARERRCTQDTMCKSPLVSGLSYLELRMSRPIELDSYDEAVGDSWTCGSCLDGDAKQWCSSTTCSSRLKAYNNGEQ
jgi:hypothetical protein